MLMRLLSCPWKVCTLILPVAIFINLSCRKHESYATRDYLVFGEITSNCSNDCIRLYRLDDFSLRVDDEVEGILKSVYQFNEMPLHPDLRARASELPDLLPLMLLALPCEIVGEPNWRSGKALVVVRKKDGERQQWIIDQNEDRLPLFIIPFKRAIQDLLLLLDR